jgi:predicted ATPase
MAITKITIGNFKGIADRVEVDLKPITILFGANSAGKSTILQAMLYLREILERRNADADRLLSSGVSIDLGGFRQFVHCHDLDREVKISVTVEVSDDGLPVVPVVELDRSEDMELRDLGDVGITGTKTVGVEITVGWNAVEGAPLIKSYATFLDGLPFARLEAESPQQCYLVEWNIDHPALLKQLSTNYESDESPGECTALKNYVERENLTSIEEGSINKCRLSVDTKSVIPDWNSLLLSRKYGGIFNWPAGDGDGEENEVEEYGLSQLVLTQVVVGAGKTILEELQKIRYVGPLRSLPERSFSALRSPSEERWADGMAAWDRLYQSAASSDEDKLIKATSDNLSEEKRLNIGYSLSSNLVYEVENDSFALNTLRLLAARSEDEDVETRIQQILKDIFESPQTVRLRLKDLATDTLVAPNDIGVGVSQVVPVIVAALYKGASVVAVEQPELHLHPAIQARMGDLFIESALRAGVENRFILESHSEHLILRLLRRIRECNEEGAEYPNHLPKINPEDLSVYYIQSEGSQTKMAKLRVSEDGDFLDRWPNGFFDERAEELF